MEQCAGIYRTGERWRRSRHELHACRSASPIIALEDRSRTFNTERLAALELTFMLDVAEAIVQRRALHARNRAARTSAPTSRRATTIAFPGALVDLAPARRLVARSSTCR